MNVFSFIDTHTYIPLALLLYTRRFISLFCEEHVIVCGEAKPGIYVHIAFGHIIQQITKHPL